MPKMTIPGVKQTTSKKGVTYYYDRVSGKRIRSKFGTAAFLEELDELRGAPTQLRAKPGTFGALIESYRGSPEFEGLADRTKKDYNRVLKYLLVLREVDIELFDSAYVLKIRDKANTRHKFRFANYVLAVISKMFNWGAPRKLCGVNPVVKGMKLKRPRGLAHQNRRWTDYELDVVIAAAPDDLKPAIALGWFHGIREGDVVSMPLSAVVGDCERLFWPTSKSGEVIDVKIHRDAKPYIRMAIEQSPRKGMTLVIGKRGRPLTEDGMRSKIWQVTTALRKQGKVGENLTFHGLRHSFGSELADRDASDSTIQSALSHKTPTQAQKYRRNANKRRAQDRAIDILEADPENES